MGKAVVQKRRSLFLKGMPLRYVALLNQPSRILPAATISVYWACATSFILHPLLLIFDLFAQDENNKWIKYILPYRLDTSEGFNAYLDLIRYQLYLNPIGWSSKGLFAYQTRFYDGHLSGEKLIIFDAVEDKLIEESFIPGDDVMEEYEEKLLLWNNILEKYQINNRLSTLQRLTEPYQLQDFPVSHNSRNLLSWFEYSVTPPFEYKDMSNKCHIEIEWDLFVGDDNIYKKVSSKGGESFSGAKILGYLKSPFEERIVIITIFRDYDFGKEFLKSRECKLELFGCHLNVGYNRRNN
jgi:hypothetical protein